jgi:hypothetical protein
LTALGNSTILRGMKRDAATPSVNICGGIIISL